MFIIRIKSFIGVIIFVITVFSYSCVLGQVGSDSEGSYDSDPREGEVLNDEDSIIREYLTDHTILDDVDEEMFENQEFLLRLLEESNNDIEDLMYKIPAHILMDLNFFHQAFRRVRGNFLDEFRNVRDEFVDFLREHVNAIIEFHNTHITDSLIDNIPADSFYDILNRITDDNNRLMFLDMFAGRRGEDYNRVLAELQLPAVVLTQNITNDENPFYYLGVILPDVVNLMVAPTEMQK